VDEQDSSVTSLKITTAFRTQWI